MALYSETEKDKEFSLIVMEHQSMVRGFLSRFIVDFHAVYDLAQEVFLAAYSGLDSFDRKRDVGAWLRGIARHKSFDYLRKQYSGKRRETLVMEDRLLKWEEEALKQVDPEEGNSLTCLHVCMEKLKAKNPEAYRMVAMKYLKGSLVSDVARAFGRTAGAVKVALFRTRRALQKCVEKAMTSEARSHV